MRTYNLYLIRVYNDEETFYKIGSTVHRYCRFYEIMKAGYQVDIVYMIMGLDFYKCYEMEAALQLYFSYLSYETNVKFGGHTECFLDIDIDIYKELVSGVEYKELMVDIPITWR